MSFICIVCCSLFDSVGVQRLRELCVFVIPLACVRSRLLLTPPPDDNNATLRPTARGIQPAHRGRCPRREGIAGHCPSLGDSARHGNARHIRSALATTSVRRIAPPCTGTPPSPT